jgi:hypothetical protein
MLLLATTTTTSSSTGLLVFDLILACVFAFLGYRSSEKFRQQWGRTPWGWPSAVWGVVCFISIVLGVILLYFARRGTRRRVQRSGGYGGGSYGGYTGSVPPGMPPPSYQQPTYGQPTYGQPTYGQPTYGEPAPWGAPPPSSPASPPPPAPASVQANWYPDPSGKHQYRYYDGSRWTDDVSDNGIALKDPLPG